MYLGNVVAEIYQGDNFDFARSMASGSCSLCRRKFPVEACSVCCAFICDYCSGFVRPLNNTERQLKLVCSACLNVGNVEKLNYGSFPQFLSLSKWQIQNLGSRCRGCQSPFTCHTPAYPCDTCQGCVCEQCAGGEPEDFGRNQCIACREGRAMLGSKTVDTCDHCHEFIIENNALWVNQSRFHPQCLPKARAAGSGKVCAYCGRPVIGESNSVMLNQNLLHSSCLNPFRKTRVYSLQ